MLRLPEPISLGITGYDRLILNRNLYIYDKINDLKVPELMNLLNSSELTQHVNEATCQYGNPVEKSTRLNISGFFV